MIITNIKEFREQNKMSQTELAQLVGVRRETIGHLENGHYNPSLVLAAKIMVQIPKNYEKVIEEICAYTNGSGIVYEKKNLLLQISKTKIINVSAAIINIFVLLICSFFVLSIKMECDFPEQKGKYIFYSQGGMTHRNIRKSIMKESFWTGGIPIIFGVVISTIFMGTEVYLKKLSLEWIKQYAVKLMGTITGIIFLFLFISICFGIRNIIRIEREE